MKIYIDGDHSAHDNMDADRSLLLKPPHSPFLRLYGWNAFAVTYGLFVTVADVLDMDACRTRKVDMAKRPTGGGVLFHGHDLAFSLFLPSTHPLYSVSFVARAQAINAVLVEALQPWLQHVCIPQVICPSSRADLCMMQQGPLDLIWHGRKIGGAAQRVNRQGILHQASIFLKPVSWENIISVLKHKDIIAHMQRICTSIEEFQSLPIEKAQIANAIAKGFREWSYEKSVAS